MLKKLKYITTVLLLVIFPISAIGLNISIHECKHTGIVHFELFEFSKANGNADCCSKSGLNRIKKDNNCSNCSQEKVNNDVQGCSKAQIFNGSDDGSNACMVAEKEQNKSINEFNVSWKNFSGIDFPKSQCCSNSNLSYQINLAFIYIDNIKGFFELPIISDNLFRKDFLKSTDINAQTSKNTQYPIKELIFNTISFIHYTSITGEDSAVPYPLY